MGLWRRFIATAGTLLWWAHDVCAWCIMWFCVLLCVIRLAPSSGAVDASSHTSFGRALQVTGCFCVGSASALRDCKQQQQPDKWMRLLRRVWIEHGWMMVCDIACFPPNGPAQQHVAYNPSESSTCR